MRFIVHLSVVACVPLLGSCSRLAQVAGVVTYIDKPLEGAVVAFIPDGTLSAERTLRPATAVTDSEGKFRLATVQHTGVVPGQYRVTVSKKVLPVGTPAPQAPEDWIRVRDLWSESLPPHYTQSATTPLRVDVPEGGKKDVRIELDAGAK